jgi:peptidoglycan/xylan/chitin deacetylase (PgdA/CDA1 family)
MSTLSIINFHGVGPITRNIDDGERDCWIETDFLKRILDLVTDYPQVAITVDDGNASDLNYLLPELSNRELKATFFLCSGKLNTDTYLSLKDAQELIKAGMKIGSHGKAHRSWRRLQTAELEDEIINSKIYLEKNLSTEITSAACPFGIYDRKSLTILRNSGYKRVYTSDMGSTYSQAWLSPRNTIRRSMSIHTIKKILEARPPYGSSLKRTIKMVIKSFR